MGFLSDCERVQVVGFSDRCDFGFKVLLVGFVLCGRRCVVGFHGPARFVWCEGAILTRVLRRVPCFALEGF